MLAKYKHSSAALHVKMKPLTAPLTRLALRADLSHKGRGDFLDKFSDFVSVHDKKSPARPEEARLLRRLEGWAA